jgi:hypothetical protein
MTPDEQIEHLEAEIDRLRREYPGAPGVLRLPNSSLRACSRWKWEQRGWTVDDSEACGIMNGNERERTFALLSVLKRHGIQRIEYVDEGNELKVVPDAG